MRTDTCIQVLHGLADTNIHTLYTGSSAASAPYTFEAELAQPQSGLRHRGFGNRTLLLLLARMNRRRAIKSESLKVEPIDHLWNGLSCASARS